MITDYSAAGRYKDGSKISTRLTIGTGTGAVVINDEDFVEDGCVIQEDLVGSEIDCLRFGECASCGFTASFAYTGDSLVGKSVTLEQFPTDHPEEEHLQVGVYKIISDVIDEYDSKVHTITAYDVLYEMHNTDVGEWYESLFGNNIGWSSLTHRDGAITLGTLRKSIENQFLEYDENDIAEAIVQLVEPSLIYAGYIDIDYTYNFLDSEPGYLDLSTGEFVPNGYGCRCLSDTLYLKTYSTGKYRINFSDDVRSLKVFCYEVDDNLGMTLKKVVDVSADNPYFDFAFDTDLAKFDIWSNVNSMSGIKLFGVVPGYNIVLPIGTNIVYGTHLVATADFDYDEEQGYSEFFKYYNSGGTAFNFAHSNDSEGKIFNAENLANCTLDATSLNQYNPQYDSDKVKDEMIITLANVTNLRNVRVFYKGYSDPTTLTSAMSGIPDIEYPAGVTYILDNPLCNDYEIVRKGFSGSVSAGALLKAYCELNGVFGHIGRDGKIKYIQLKSADGLHPHIGLHPHTGLHPSSGQNPKEQLGYEYENGSLQYSNYKTIPITKLQIRATANDVGAIAGASGNDYVIENNPLTYSMGAEQLQRVADNLLPILSQASYTPYSVTAMGNPCIEVGDAVTMFREGGSTEGYVLHRVLRGIQSLTDEYSAEGSEVYEDAVNGINHELQRIQGKFMEIDKSIDGLSTVIGDVDQNLIHKIQITAEGLDAEISRATGAETAIRTSVDGLSVQINGEDGISHGLEVTQQALSSEISRATSAEGSLSSSLQQTATSLSSEITRATAAEGNLSSSIQQTASSLSSEITRAQGAESTLSSSIQQTASALTSEVSRAQSAESSLSSSISQTASEVALKVSKSGIVSDLNSAMSSGITVRSNGIDINSNGALTINTSKFILDSNGNATFKGNVNGAVITSGNGALDMEGALFSSQNVSPIRSENRDLQIEYGELEVQITDRNTSEVYSKGGIKDNGGDVALYAEYEANGQTYSTTVRGGEITMMQGDTPCTVLTSLNFSEYIPNGNGVSY